MSNVILNAIAIVLCVWVLQRRWCILHFKRNIYRSRVSKMTKCAGCEASLRMHGEPPGFHEEWIAKNWERL